MGFGLENVLELATDAFSERIASLGKTESGAYDYYAARIENNCLLSADEAKLAQQLAETYPKDTIFYEIGAGAGTLCLALAAYGYRCVAIESDRRRFEAALDIQESLSAYLPDFENYFMVEQAIFGVDPVLYMSSLTGPKVGVITNLVNSWVDEKAPLIIGSLSKFQEAVFNPLRIGHNRTIGEQDEILNLIEGADPVLFMDMGPEAQYVRVVYSKESPPQITQPQEDVEPVPFQKETEKDEEPTKPSAFTAFNGQYKDVFQIARTHYLNKEFTEAITLLKPWLVTLRAGSDIHRDGLSILIRSTVNQKKTPTLDLAFLTQLGITLYPAHRDFQLYHARACRDLDAHLKQFTAYKKAMRAGAREDECIWGMIQALVNRKRFKMAEKLIRTIDLAETPFKAFPTLACEVHLVNGNLDDAQKCLDRAYEMNAIDQRLKQYELVLKSLKAHQNLSDPALTTRHIAIGGTSYVGSTIFGVILGSLDTLENIGESNWLIQSKDSHDNSSLIDFDNDLPTSWPLCKVHRRQTRQCIPIDFRKSLAADPTNYYEKIARQLNTPGLVTGDKSLANYWFLDPLARFDLIILYKHPILQMRSNIRNLSKKLQNEANTKGGFDFERQLHFWSQHYLGLLNNITPKGKRLVLNWEKFASAPHAHLKVICDQLGLTYRDDILENITVNHLLGGNAGIKLDQILKTGKIQMRTASHPRFSEEEEARIMSHPEAGHVLHLLENYHNRFFKSLAR
ncbi:hypothetical protein [Terasakiella pusilla]|uniref:hypothetical protein n=1 Tax=Terasakiella pusilla TaxID=64973 RepID=UPI003AA7C381